MTPPPCTVLLRVDAARHVVTIPPEWSGTVTLSVTFHRGRPSSKILVGRATAMYLQEQEEKGRNAHEKETHAERQGQEEDAAQGRGVQEAD